METKFASPERSGLEKLTLDYTLIRSIDHIQDLLDALPFVTAILNENRQIVYCNEATLKATGNISVEQILGKRPGEAISCIYSCVEAAGCGTSEHCKVCGAALSITHAQQLNEKNTEECRISTLDEDGNPVAFDFMVSSTPMNWNGRRFIVFSINDISHEKRRKVLERIFFHDIINKAGSLRGFIDILKKTSDLESIKDYISTADLLSHELTEELISQRTLLEAENEELRIDPAPVNTSDLLCLLTGQIALHPVAETKRLIVDKDTVSLNITSDPLILSRILTNMLKNALEATDAGGEVVAGCRNSDDKVTFWIKNQKIIPEIIRLQIFQRSFSTKGSDRGIGTYSMKLLGEKYLKGKVSFTSDESNGTVFYLRLPHNIENSNVLSTAV
jgi:K+-sensing histidine kinase KdpD